MTASSSVAVNRHVSRQVGSSVVADSVAAHGRLPNAATATPDAPDDPKVGTVFPEATASVATLSACLPTCPCGAPLKQKKHPGGSPRRFCSARCRARVWSAQHPRLRDGRKRPRRLWKVVDRGALPACYLKTVPDTLAIGKTLLRGEEVPGVERT